MSTNINRSSATQKEKVAYRLLTEEVTSNLYGWYNRDLTTGQGAGSWFAQAGGTITQNAGAGPNGEDTHTITDSSNTLRGLASRGLSDGVETFEGGDCISRIVIKKIPGPDSWRGFSWNNGQSYKYFAVINLENGDIAREDQDFGVDDSGLPPFLEVRDGEQFGFPGYWVIVEAHPAIGGFNFGLVYGAPASPVTPHFPAENQGSVELLSWDAMGANITPSQAWYFPFTETLDAIEAITGPAASGENLLEYATKNLPEWDTATKRKFANFQRARLDEDFALANQILNQMSRIPATTKRFLRKLAETS